MSLTETLEEKFGLKIETLNTVEKETYLKMLEEVHKTQMTPEKLRGYVVTMREAVEKELVNTSEFKRWLVFAVPNRKQIFLKARLYNYLLLESFLGSPERAQKALEEIIASVTRI